MFVEMLTLHSLTQVKDEESQTEEIVKSIQTTSGLAQKAKETYSQRCQVCHDASGYNLNNSSKLRLLSGIFLV